MALRPEKQQALLNPKNMALQHVSQRLQGIESHKQR